MLDLKNRLFVSSFSNEGVSVAKEFGIGLEINHTCISESLDIENRENLITEIKRDLQEVGLEHSIMHGPFTEIHPAAIDYRVRDLGRERLEEAFEVAKELKVNKMVVHTGWIPFIYFKSYQEEKGAEFWTSFMEDKPSDFTICVENVLEDEPYTLLNMMKRINDPRIKLCLDIGHANAARDKFIFIEEWIETLGPYIGHFHLHNNFGDGDNHLPLMEGSMNMDSIFMAIEKNCKSDVTFTIESRDAKASLLWLKEQNYF